jgi:AAA domain
MLRSLHLKDVGPAARFDLELGDRLNVLTGDNGLGKSFILDVAWWALTGTWVGRAVLPKRGKENSAALAGDVLLGGQEYPFDSHYVRIAQGWENIPRAALLTRTSLGGAHAPAWLEGAAPVIYVRADAGFSVWDPARNHEPTPDMLVMGEPIPYHFSPNELWNGLIFIRSGRGTFYRRC